MSCWKCGSGQHLAEIQRYPASPSQIAGVGGTPEVDMNFEDEKPFMELVFVDSDTVGGKQAWIMVESDQRVRQMMNAESEDTPRVRCNRCRQGFLQDIPRYEMVNNKPVECDNCRARFEVVSQGTASKLKTTSRRNKYFHAETFDAERGCSYPCPDCGTQMFQHNSNTGFGSYCSCWKCGSNYITKPIDAEMEGRDYQ